MENARISALEGGRPRPPCANLAPFGTAPSVQSEIKLAIYGASVISCQHQSRLLMTFDVGKSQAKGDCSYVLSPDFAKAYAGNESVSPSHGGKYYASSGLLTDEAREVMT